MIDIHQHILTYIIVVLKHTKYPEARLYLFGYIHCLDKLDLCTPAIEKFRTLLHSLSADTTIRELEQHFRNLIKEQDSIADND